MGFRIALTADPEIPVPPVGYGGIERIVDMLARRLSDRGHSVTLLAHPGSSCPVKKIPWPGPQSRRRRDTLRNAAALARQVGIGRFDLVHSFSRIAYLTPILPLPIPKLMSYQREISPETTRLGHLLSRGTLHFTAVSKGLMGAGKRAGRWYLVPNGVPLGTFQFRRQVPADAPLVFLGRIERIKGTHLAIEVARRTGLPLVIAGNVADEHRDFFESHIRPYLDGQQITYVGPVDDAQKNTLLGRARALLMPVLWEEPFGIVMTEAMACGTPVVGLNRGSVAEVVDHGVTGFVCEDLDGLVRAAARTGEIPRAACRDRVERLFSDQAVVDAYLHVYHEIQPAPGSST